MLDDIYDQRGVIWGELMDQAVRLYELDQVCDELFEVIKRSDVAL